MPATSSRSYYPRLSFLLFFTILFCYPLCLLAQGSGSIQVIDSLKTVIRTEKAPLKQFLAYNRLLRLDAVSGHLDSVPYYNRELFRIASEQKSDSLLMEAYDATAYYLDFKTDTKPELEYIFKALRIAEAKYPHIKARLYYGLGAAYQDIPDYKAAIKYLSMALESYKVDTSVPAIRYGPLYLHLATSYLKDGKVDSALHFSQLATSYIVKGDNKVLNGALLCTTAQVYAKLGKDAIAADYFKHAVDTAVNSQESYVDADSYNWYSQFLLEKGALTAAKTNGLIGLHIARSSQAKKPFLQIVATLRQVYEGLDHPDSAYYYSKLELAYRDSLYNSQKLSDVQNMTFAEQVRESEEALKRNEEAVQRAHNLQYAAIALGLVLFLIAFLLFSHTVVANQKVIRFLGVLSLLVFFEFINLMLHPYVGNLTHHSPALMLVFMVGLAALLIPLHHKLEHWITHKMVEKNNKIRLAAAKKTIQQLEGSVSR